MSDPIPLERIDDNPFQTRGSYDPDGIGELAADIDTRGLLQPPVARIVLHGIPILPDVYGGVRPALDDEPDARVQLAFGHRRLRAYRLLAQGAGGARYAFMPLVVKTMTDEEMALAAWSENAQRKDIGPLEEALAIQRMTEQFGWTQEQIAQKLNLSRPTVSNKLRLLRLPDPVKHQLANGALSERQASALLPLADLPEAVIKEAEKTDQPWNFLKPSSIISQASKCSSDDIRQQVASMVRGVTYELGRTGYCPTDVEIITGGPVLSPRCDDCIHRIRIDGQLRCPDRRCLDLKQKLWIDKLLKKASQALGIGSLGAGAEIDLSAVDGLDAAPQIARRQPVCPNLRLAYYGGFTGQAVPEYPGVRILCAHGKGKTCKCLAEITGQNKEAEARAQRESKRRIREELVQPAVTTVTAALIDKLPSGLLRKILYNVDYTAYNKLVDPSQEAAVAALAKKLVANAMGWNGNDNFVKMRKALDDWFAYTGLDVPWQTPAAEVIENKLLDLEGFMRNRSENIPEPVKISATLGQTKRLAGELNDVRGAGQISQEDDDRLLQRILALRDALEAMLPAAEATPEKERERFNSALYWLWYSIGSEIPNNVAALKPYEARYALAYLLYRREPKQQSLYDALIARCAELDAPAKVTA